MGVTETESAREVVTEYFAAIGEQDMQRAGECWEPGCIDRIVGFDDLVAPEGVREWFEALFEAAPDARLEVTSTVAEGDQVAVRWRMTGTFNGSGKFEGLVPNGRPIDLEGCDLLTVRDGKIISNHAYSNGMVFARQVGVLPPAGSGPERAMAAAFNAKTAVAKRLRSSG